MSKKFFIFSKNCQKNIKMSKNRKSFQESRKNGQKSLLFCQQENQKWSKMLFILSKNGQKVIKMSKNQKSFQKSRKNGQKSFYFGKKIKKWSKKL